MHRFYDETKQAHILQICVKVDDINEQIAYLRSSVIGKLIDECTKTFVKNEEAILSGTFEGSLIKHISQPVNEAYDFCAELSFRRIYRSKDVLDIELA